MVFASGVKKYPRSSRKLTVPWESTVTFVTRPVETGLFSFLQWEDYSRKKKCSQGNLGEIYLGGSAAQIRVKSEQ